MYQVILTLTSLVVFKQYSAEESYGHCVSGGWVRGWIGEGVYREGCNTEDDWGVGVALDLSISKSIRALPLFYILGLHCITRRFYCFQERNA